MNCTTCYYWYTVLGGGICQYDDKWYRNWEFYYNPPEKEVVQEEIPIFVLELIFPHMAKAFPENQNSRPMCCAVHSLQTLFLYLLY